MDVSENANLGKCRVCQGTVSKKAKVCPHCGEKNPHQEDKKGSAPALAWAILGFFLLCLFVPEMIVPLIRDEATKRPPEQSNHAAR